jgi:invasion protein IalB
MTGKMEVRLPAKRSGERGMYGVWAQNAPFAARRTRAQRIIAGLIPLLAAVAFTASLAAPAHALTVQEQGWQVANSKCNSGDAKQCELRDRLSAVLKRHGCLYHEDGDWWKCSGAR